MADILTQDEIDRLLNAAAGSEVTPELPEMRPSEVEAAANVAKVFFASANSALASLLARPASVSEGLGQVVNIADLDTGKAFLIRFPFRSGFEGELAFLIRHKESSVLADLILGGSGAAKDTLEEADLDALKETLTQVAGSGVPTLSEILGREVGFDPPTLHQVGQGSLADALPLGIAFVNVGSIRVDGAFETPFRLLLPLAIAREMVKAAKHNRKETNPGPSSSRTFAEAPLLESPHPVAPPTTDMRNIDLILDIEVEVMVRLGEAEMPLREIQKLRPGSIIDLDKDTDAPVELVVNDRVIAKGELVVVGSDHFALRITDIETPTERIRKLGA